MTTGNDAAARPAGAADHALSAETLSGLLNPPQLEAVLWPPRPLLVVAGAGSGKTRVIVYRIARLIAEGADPRRVLAVTFTNKAAGELRERVTALLSSMGRSAGGLWVGTFHSVAARLLRRFGEAIGLRREFVIYDDDDQRRLMSRILIDLNVQERMFPVRQVMSEIDSAQNKGIRAADFHAANHMEDVVRRAYEMYEQRLRAANAVDFGGLLLEALRLAQEDTPARRALSEMFDHVLVDEFQDTNAVQYRLVRHLSRRSDSVTVVGDEDQSIYRWRGADIRNILDFERDHDGAQLIKLEQNYRSTRNILRAANAIIDRNRERRPKRLFTEGSEGSLLVVFEGETERDEAQFVAGRIADGLAQNKSPRDFAVFYRTNAQSRALEDALRARDLPYVVVGGTRFFDRVEVKDLLGYLRAIANPDDDIALQRILNVPARGIGDTSAERVAALASGRRLTFWQALEAVAAEPTLIAGRTGAKIVAFVQLMRKLRSEGQGLGPAALADKVLDETGYRQALAADNTLEAQGRMENLQELVAQMREYEKEDAEPTLHGFLERIALSSDQDSYDPARGAVSLMTVHTAKGLEFDTVFITGLEERVFPHARSLDDDSQMEEERRLCYVAVTRAERDLMLTRVRRRRLGGQQLPGVPSRFLREIPPECIELIVQEPPPESGIPDARGMGPWGGEWSRPGSERDFMRPRPVSGRSGGPSFSHPSGRPPVAPASKGPRELTVHYDEADDGMGLQIGLKLRHPSFGIGEVRGWQSSGADLKVTMHFAGVGVKTILAKFLKKP